MKDRQGVNRGACTAPECECDEYALPSSGHSCDYCGCVPVRHAKIETDISALEQKVESLVVESAGQQIPHSDHDPILEMVKAHADNTPGSTEISNNLMRLQISILLHLRN